MPCRAYCVQKPQVATYKKIRVNYMLNEGHGGREGERRREKERDREEQKIHAVQNYLNNDVS